nr:MAG TPA: hypothetical protein [Caudoviricetes sp.]
MDHRLKPHTHQPQQKQANHGTHKVEHKHQRVKVFHASHLPSQLAPASTLLPGTGQLASFSASCSSSGMDSNALIPAETSSRIISDCVLSKNIFFLNLVRRTSISGVTTKVNRFIVVAITAPPFFQGLNL